jgi:hypothetical protein
VLSLLVLGSVGAAALHYWAVERRFLAMRGPRPFLANSRVAPSAPQAAGDGRGEASKQAISLGGRRRERV